MSREVRRVPLDFDWPLNTVWAGYLSPESLREATCRFCDGTGYSPAARRLHDRWYGDAPFHPSETGSEPLTPDTPAVRAFAERNVRTAPEFYGGDESAIRREGARLAGMWNGQWAHHLHQNDVDALVAAGRLYDFTHTWAKGSGWVPKDPQPVVTAAEVNEWHILPMGHDSINSSVVVEAACVRTGQPFECPRCAGHGTVEKHPGQRAEAEAWEATEPPAGDGWQLWTTVTEGSPISPVFTTAEGLASWLTEPGNRDRMDYDAALRFVRAGWAPTGISTPETGYVPGPVAVGLNLFGGES